MILSQNSSLLRLGWMTIAILLASPGLGKDQTLPRKSEPTLSLQELVDSYKKTQSELLYNECSVENGKALLVVSPKNHEIWYYEFIKGWHVNSAKIVITGNDFKLTYGFGGIYSQERMRRITEALMKSSFVLLLPDKIDGMLTSKPTNKCPELDPRELYREPVQNKSE